METRDQIIARIEDAKARMQAAAAAHGIDSEEFNAAYADQLQALEALGAMDRQQGGDPSQNS